MNSCWRKTDVNIAQWTSGKEQLTRRSTPEPQNSDKDTETRENKNKLHLARDHVFDYESESCQKEKYANKAGIMHESKGQCIGKAPSLHLFHTTVR